MTAEERAKALSATPHRRAAIARAIKDALRELGWEVRARCVCATCGQNFNDGEGCIKCLRLRALLAGQKGGK